MENDKLAPKVAEVVKEGSLEFKEKEQDLKLTKIPTEDDIKRDLGLPQVIEEEKIDPVFDAQTDKLIEDLFGGKLDDHTKKRYVNEMGMKYQTALANHSKILDQSMRTLSKTQDGGSVAKNLLELRNQVEDLNPKRYNLSSPAGATAKFFRRLLGKNNPISRYFEKYESAQHVISDIIENLKAGRDQLIDDNKTLEFDKKALRDSLEGLVKAIKIGEILYKKMENKLKTEIEQDSDQYRFIQEELLFPLNQRIIDLQTTLAVNQQGVISYDLLVRNNNELVTGVNRTVTITASALRIAVTTRLALEKQRQVLEAKKKIDETTSDLIEENARVLQTQGVEIQKMAAESTINVDKLANAFETLNQAIDEISNFRRESLPAMRNTVEKFKHLTDEAGETIKRMEQGSAVKDNVIMDITALE
ncbi:MAG: toxic anion resistance protein [Bacteroidales bacterium]|nr:toxic anion resistance protein [Bacteroidales bacterium]